MKKTAVNEFDYHNKSRQSDFVLEKLLLGIVARPERKIVLCSAQISEYIEVRTIPLNWGKEKSHGRLGATLTLLGKMCRRY